MHYAHWHSYVKAWTNNYHVPILLRCEKYQFCGQSQFVLPFSINPHFGCVWKRRNLWPAGVGVCVLCFSVGLRCGATCSSSRAWMHSCCWGRDDLLGCLRGVSGAWVSGGQSVVTPLLAFGSCGSLTPKPIWTERSERPVRSGVLWSRRRRDHYMALDFGRWMVISKNSFLGNCFNALGLGGGR